MQVSAHLPQACSSGKKQRGGKRTDRFEGYPCAHGGLSEDHGHSLAGKRLVALVAGLNGGLDLDGRVKHGLELLLRSAVTVS